MGLPVLNSRRLLASGMRHCGGRVSGQPPLVAKLQLIDHHHRVQQFVTVAAPASLGRRWHIQANRPPAGIADAVGT